jgi:hypothetical protein
LITPAAKQLALASVLALAACHDWDALDRMWAGADAGQCTSSLVTNGDFEQGTQGWGTNTGATLVQASGHGGGSAAQVCSGAGGPDRLHDVPPTVAVTTANQQYTLVAWVNPGTTTERLRVNLKELDASSNVLDSNFELAPTVVDWSSVLVHHTITHPGSALSIEVLDTVGAASTCFEVDDVCLTVSPP